MKRLSQQKLNASFSDCDFFFCWVKPPSCTWLSALNFQPAINFLYLGIIWSMWAAACLVSCEMFHSRLVSMLHFRHTDTEVEDSLPWNTGSPQDQRQTRFDTNGLCSQGTSGRVLREIQITVLIAVGTMSCFASQLSTWLNQGQVGAASGMDLKSSVEVMFLFTCSW